MKKLHSSLLFTALLLSPLATAPVAADDDFLTAFKACQKIENDASRLACFDGLDTRQARVPAVATAPTPKKLTQEEKEDAFGASTIITKRKAEAKAEEDEELNELTMALVETGKTRSGKYFFLLENGQMWRQIKADTTRLPLPKKLDGVTVTIKRKKLGSHRLTLKGRSVRVKRIR